MPNMNDKVGAQGQLDIGLAIGAPFKDKDWLKKCLVIGLMMLIPIAGALNLSGWMRAIAEKRMAGGPDADILPEANLSYMGGGWKLFLAYLPMMGIVFVVLIGGGIAAGVAAATGNGRASEDIMVGVIIATYGIMILLMIAMSVVGPAITFLHIVEGEPWASVQFKRIWETMKAGGVQYLLLFVALMVAGVVGQLGALACYVGMFVTIPLGQVMAAAAVAEYARLVKMPAPTFPVDGGTGSSSGNPFPVKN
jgi:hypothetical protein